MTQKDLIKTYIEEFGSILPAKMYGKVYKGEMFGSETSKRCREMRKSGLLRSEEEGKFERFYLAGASYNGNTATPQMVNRSLSPLASDKDMCNGDYKCYHYRTFKYCSCQTVTKEQVKAKTLF